MGVGVEKEQPLIKIKDKRLEKIFRMSRSYHAAFRSMANSYRLSAICIGYHAYASGASPPGLGKISSSFFITSGESLISAERKLPVN